MNKSSRETRMGRSENRSSLKLDSVYYKVVAILLAILVVLVIYITFQQRNASKKNQTESPSDEVVVPADSETNHSENSETNEVTDTEQDEENNSAKEVVTEGINKNAPLDPNYEVSYEEGSSDMKTVLTLSRQVTGLGDDMYPVWIGNNGPGKVQATVSSQDNSKQFVVDLQYGGDSWHVTHVEQIVE